MVVYVKRYTLAEFFYVVLCLMPVLLFFDPEITLTIANNPIAAIVLIASNILVMIITTSCGIFYEFESYKKSFIVTSLGSDPRDRKSSDLSSYIMNFFFNLVPFIASLFVLDACLSAGKVTQSLFIVIACLVYNLTMIIMYIIRLNKMFKFINETAEEDAKWAEVKWDVTKLIRVLTLENHRLEFTPSYVKDISFIEFKNMITKEVSKLKSFNELDDRKKLIVLQEAVKAAWMYEAMVCTDKYVELEWWIKGLGPFFIV